MQYYLSRNNHVTGPYPKEALLRHGILPSDLIKEESGAEWRAPESFSEFKGAAGIAKPKYKITADKEVVEVKNDIPKNQEPPEMPANSPFKRMPSAVSRKKNMDENTDVQKAETRKDISRSPVKTAATNAEQTPKTEYKKVAKAPVIRAQRKENATNAFKEIFAPLFILGGIGFAAWFGYKKFFSSPAGPSNAAVQAVPADSLSKQPLPDTAVPTKSVAVKKAVTDSSAYYARRDSIRQAERAEKDSLALLATAAAKKDSVHINKAATESTTIKKEATVPENKKTNAASNTAATVKPAEKKNATAKKSNSIGDYVALSLNKIPDKEIKGIRLNVKNISSQALNIAVVDVSYLDPNGNVIRGETLQAENIGAGKSVSVKVPNEKKAANISYKVSLISGDSVYLMGK